MARELGFDQTISVRVTKQLYDLILARRERVFVASGFRPSISDVARTMLEQAAWKKKPQRQPHVRRQKD